MPIHQTVDSRVEEVVRSFGYRLSNDCDPKIQKPYYTKFLFFKIKRFKILGHILCSHPGPIRYVRIYDNDMDLGSKISQRLPDVRVEVTTEYHNPYSGLGGP